MNTPNPKLFNSAFNFVIGAEGGYVNDPRDPGGETKYGISKRAYPNENIPEMTLDRAHSIYKSDYWNKCHCYAFPYIIALPMFDCAVNQGVRFAIKAAQRSCGSPADGIMGSMTTMMMQGMDDKLFLDAFLAIREAHYKSLKTFSIYGKGWMNRLAHVRKEALS